MNRILNLICRYCLLFAFVAGTAQAADNGVSYTAPEVTLGSLHCKAEWNEFCEDQKIVQVPDGYRLCKPDITVNEQLGDSHYEITHTDEHGITVSFNAKGNRDRLKPQGAVIDLAISLKGVRNDDDCAGGKVRIVPTATNIDKNPPPEPPPSSPEIFAARSTPNAAEIATHPAAPANTESSGAKVHACACSQMLAAEKLSRCLAYGETREHASCDTLGASIQCVASKDECHELQNNSCYQMLGINQSTSQKRVFVPDSIYCHRKAAGN